MKLRTMLLAFMASVGMISAAIGADLPVKAAAPSTWLTGYPFASSGAYVGLFTEAGVSSVTANVPGVSSASLTSTSAGIGGTVGYAWGSRNSALAYSVEFSGSATNINGANQGFALSGPVSLELMGGVWMPVSVIQNAFSILTIPNPFSSIAPFPPLPAGVTASNVQAGFLAGVRADDMTVAFQGIGSNKVWEVGPQIEAALMEQLSTGSAIREYVKVTFPTKDLLFGATQTTATPSIKYMAGVGVYF